jgi:hypothetical protein
MYEIIIETDRYEKCSYKQTFLFSEETDFEKYFNYQPITLILGQTIHFYSHSKNFCLSSIFQYDKLQPIRDSLYKTFIIDEIKSIFFVVVPINKYDYKLHTIIVN